MDSQQHNRMEVLRELKSRMLKPINRAVFAKTPAEKIVLKNTILEHNRMLRAAGLNPKKHLNLMPK